MNINKPDRNIEETALKDVMGKFVSSYAVRNKSVNFSNWLATQLQEEIPDMLECTSQMLSGDIIDAVAGYDQTLSANAL